MGSRFLQAKWWKRTLLVSQKIPFINQVDLKDTPYSMLLARVWHCEAVRTLHTHQMRYRSYLILNAFFTLSAIITTNFTNLSIWSVVSMHCLSVAIWTKLNNKQAEYWLRALLLQTTCYFHLRPTICNRVYIQYNRKILANSWFTSGCVVYPFWKHITFVQLFLLTNGLQNCFCRVHKLIEKFSVARPV